MIKVSYDNLFAYLYKNNISSLKLSEKAGISRNTIIKMKNNEPVHLSVILAICEAYNLELSEVINITRD